jgi:hypothetical protein
MALPLTLVILLFGSALVATAFYVVQNMYSTSGHSVTRTELYNAAQSGIEKGRALLAENLEDLDVSSKEYETVEDPLDLVRVTKTSDGEFLDKDLSDGVSIPDMPNVTLTVHILDCNYNYDDMSSNLDEDEIALLPPSWPGGTGEGTGETEDLEGTSAIIDPTRYFNFGGGAGERRYVIRSRALEEKSQKKATIEVMVVVK